MASVEKYTQNAIYAILHHNTRGSATHSNPDIDISKIDENYLLSQEHGCTDFDYFKSILDNYHCMNRKDIVKMASWIITAPDDLPLDQEYDFFSTCRDFLNLRYGAENELQTVVHYDEIHSYMDKNTGEIKVSRPHLHYCFIPAIIEKNGDLHICAKKVINRADLRNFHHDLQKFLSEKGISATVHSGITQKQGGNISVSNLKAQNQQINLTYERDFNF